MLGWDIAIYTQPDGSTPATMSSKEGDVVARWETGLGGLDWIDAIVAEGKATSLGGNGYPIRYTFQAKHLLAGISKALDSATFVRGIDTHGVEGRPDEWLLVEAWDMS